MNDSQTTQHDDAERNSSEYVAEAEVDTFSEDTDDATPEQKLKQLRDKFKQCDAEKRQAMEDLQRTRADFLNSKRMLDEQAERAKARVVEKHIEELLPLVDSFDMAVSDPLWNTVDEKWRKGIDGIRSQLQTILGNAQVKSIEQAGVAFDPTIHEAVMEQPAMDGVAPHTVMTILQKGYTRGDIVIRPAKVIVSA